jgi:hypothetical protein
VRVVGGSPSTPDSVGPLEVGEHEDVKEFGAGGRPERVEACSESALHVWQRDHPNTVSLVGDTQCISCVCSQVGSYTAS